jgi:hypothetical protein
LPIEGELPDLGGANAWLNSEPVTPVGLRGKVVLVQFCRVDGAESDAFERTAREALELCGELHGLPAGENVELRAKLL